MELEDPFLGVQATPGGAVLVVDGCASSRDLLVGALRRAGLPALHATTSEEAVDLVTRYPIVAMLLDAELPGGLEALRALRGRAATQTLPVLLVGAHAGASARIAGLEAGASDYLAKPVDLDEIVARAQAHLRIQAAWLDIVEQQVRDRVVVTDLLRRVRVEAAPELTAAALCRELTRVRGVSSAAVVGFAAEALPLAVSGRLPVAAGWPLPRHVADALRARADGGPWVTDQDEGGFLADPAAAYTAYSPLRSRGSLAGLLVIAGHVSPRVDPVEARARQLEAAVDFAAVASVLLCSALEQWASTCSARAQLEWVLGGDAFRPVFQPIYDVESGEVVGYEALTRFTDGAPAEPRFAEAVAVGLGLEIEAVTLAAAIHGAALLPDGAWVSVNVSPAFLLQRKRLVQAIHASPRPLVLELTEHDPIDDYPAIRAAVDRLGSPVQLSIDDAGTGYACLNHVLSLRPDFVKLDRAWVRDIDTDPARQALVAGLVHFTSRTGAVLIAEGVETDAELDVISRLGVPLAQGFLLGRPVTVGV